MNPVKQTEAPDTPSITPTCIRCDQTRALLCGPCSRASAAELMADYSTVARQSLSAAERSQLAYSTVLDAYRDLLLVVRDQDGDKAMLRAQVTELLGRCDVGQAKILQLEMAARRASPPDPLRLVQRRTAYTVMATEVGR